jgi:hypothetical protein
MRIERYEFTEENRHKPGFYRLIMEGRNIRYDRGKAIMVSYRHEDSRHMTERVAEKLASAFGAGNLFKDVDSIRPAAKWLQAIENAICHSAVVLVVIGSKWLEVADQDGTRRLDQAGDVVRLEVELALELGIPVVPLFVDGAGPPAREKLPASIRELVDCQGISIEGDPRFLADVDRLVRKVRELI